MNIYTGLLFQSGHIADAKLAISLATVASGSAPSPVGDHSQPRRAAKREGRARFRHGSIFDACSVALSPFR